MKPAPAKSVLDGNLTVSQTAELANEMLNEAQRARGGDVVREDESRYLATIRRLDAPGAWSGEVIGPPALYPLTTVNVLTANKTVMVLDKANQKLWQSALTYNVAGGLGALDAEHAPYGQGPCVERKDALYVFDQGVLTAFDLANGQRALALALGRHHGAVLRRPGHDLRQHHHRQPGHAQILQPD